MRSRKIPIAVVVTIVVAIVLVDVFVLPAAVRVLFEGRGRGASVLPPLAADPPSIVRVLAASPSADLQILLKPVRDAADQNAFHDATMNRRVLGLGFERWRFYQLVVANFSRTESFALDLAASPIDVRLEGGASPVRAHTAEDVLAESPPGVARSGAVVLGALGRGPGVASLPPHSISTWLLALPADRVDAAGGRLALATLRSPSFPSDVVLAPAVVRKTSLDDFLVSPAVPLELTPDALQVSRLGSPPETSLDATPEEAVDGEYAPR